MADMVKDIERDEPGIAVSHGISSAALRAGDLVRQMRQEAGLSQAGLGRLIEVSQARVSDIEAGLGTQGPTWFVMDRVAKACGKRLCAVPS